MCSSWNRDTIILNFLQKDMRGSCVRVPQRPIVTHCHPLENQKGPFLPYFRLFLPASLRWGRKWHLKWRGWETLRPNLLGKMENWIELWNFKFKGLGSGLSPVGTWIHSSPSASLSSSSVKYGYWVGWFPWLHSFCIYELMIQMTLKGISVFSSSLWGSICLLISFANSHWPLVIVYVVESILAW